MPIFVPPRADQDRLPVLLISGFLGSGKTTLVNGLLADPRLADTAVAINEYGDAPLDHHLVENGDDGTVLLANGCLCCNVSGDLDEAVMRIFSRREAGQAPRFQRLIIEPSGLADPAPIAQAILRNPIMSRALRLEGIVTTVDAVFGEDQLRRHPETRKQVMLADHLILTKTDLVDEAKAARLEDRLRRLNPAAPVTRARDGGIDAAIVLPHGFVDLGQADPPLSRTGTARPAPGMLADVVSAPSDHGEPAVAILLTADTPLRWRAFDAWLRDIRLRHADQVLRIKGLVNAAEARGPLVIHGVHHVLHPPVERAGWPDADRRTRIMLITQGLDGALIEDAWRAALPQIAAAALAPAML